MKCIGDEKLSEATSEEFVSEEDDFILFSLKMYLEGNNEKVKAYTLLGNKYWINIVWQLFGPSSQLHETK